MLSLVRQNSSELMSRRPQNSRSPFRKVRALSFQTLLSGATLIPLARLRSGFLFSEIALIWRICIVSNACVSGRTM